MRPGAYKFALYLYAALSLLLALFILSSSIARDISNLLLYGLVYLLISLLCLIQKKYCIIYSATIAILISFSKTSYPGYNIDISIGIVALCISLYMFRHIATITIDVIDTPSILLYIFSILSLISMSFSIIRIISFAPVSHFGYYNYAFNTLGLPSDDLILHVLFSAANVFTWFGIYFCLKEFDFDDNKKLNVLLLVVFALNAAVLMIQNYFLPEFLFPSGFTVSRFNGLTSFCYALGAVSETAFVLAPLWWMRRGAGLFRSVCLAAFIVLAMWWSGSRNALFVVVAAAVLWFAYYLYYLLKNKKYRNMVVVLLLFVISAIMVLSIYIITPYNSDNAVGRLKLVLERRGLVNFFLETRFSVYPLLFNMILAHPVSGVGVGTFYAEISKFNLLNMPDYSYSTEYLLSSNPPNLYLSIFVEMGVFAFLAFIVVIIYILTIKKSGTASTLKLPFLWIGLVVVSIAHLTGPDIYNSEATVLFWMIAAAIMHYKRKPQGEEANLEGNRAMRLRGPVVLFAAIITLLLFVYANIITLGELNPNKQWSELRWHLDIGFYPPEPGGRWSMPEATFTISAEARFLVIDWHAGSPAAADYKPTVTFYIDGKAADAIKAEPGKHIESVLQLPEGQGPHMISVYVDGAFVPSRFLDVQDDRRLGIFIHGIRTVHSLEGVSGFWPPEGFDEGRFSWTKRRAYLLVPKGGKGLRLSYRAGHTDIADRPVHVSVRVHGGVLREFAVADNQWHYLTLEIEEEDVGGFRFASGVLMSIEVDRCFVPDEIVSNGDKRRLGLAIKTD